MSEQPGPMDPHGNAPMQNIGQNNTGHWARGGAQPPQPMPLGSVPQTAQQSGSTSPVPTPYGQIPVGSVSSGAAQHGHHLGGYQPGAPQMPNPGQPVVPNQSVRPNPPIAPNAGQPLGPYSGPPQLPHPGLPPLQRRVYTQPRFAPTVTQEMRLRAAVQAPQRLVSDTPWTGAVRRSQPVEEPGSTANIVRLVAVIAGIAILTGGLLILALLGSLNFGVRLFGLVGLSAVPLTGIIGYVLWLDRWKPQPKLLLALCVLWGGVAAVIITLLVSFIGDIALYMAGVGTVPDVFDAVVQAPIVEETTKTSLLVIIVLAARRHFEGPLDGLVYGALIGAGFAFTENVLYLGSAWQESTSGLWVTFGLRCLCSPLLHTAFSTCAGVSIGFAARRWPWWATALMWLPGLLVGMCLHSIWNGTMTGLAQIGTLPQVIGLVALSILLTSGWVILGLLLRRSERLHTVNMLGDYANSGWLSHAEVDMLGTWKGRRFGRTWAAGFPTGKANMSQMIHLAGQLSTIRMRVLAGLGGQKERALETYRLNEFAATRDRLLAATGSSPGTGR